MVYHGDKKFPLPSRERKTVEGPMEKPEETFLTTVLIEPAHKIDNLRTETLITLSLYISSFSIILFLRSWDIKPLGIVDEK